MKRGLRILVFTRSPFAARPAPSLSRQRTGFLPTKGESFPIDDSETVQTTSASGIATFTDNPSMIAPQMTMSPGPGSRKKPRDVVPCPQFFLSPSWGALPLLQILWIPRR